MIEHRKFIRLKAPIGATYHVVRKGRRTRTSPTLLKDISGGGVRLLVHEELRRGELLRLEIRIPHLSDPIDAVGEVVWTAEKTEEGQSTREAGLKFRDIHAKDLKTILEFVHMIGIG